MAMGAASILLMTMVSLVEALLLLVAAGASAAAVSGGTTTIRLPSDAARGPAGVADALVRAMARAKLGDEKRPWECCDLAICTRSFPPICQCLDEVERCSDACKDCEETEGSRHVCADRYFGDPGPMCHDHDHDHEHANGRGGAGGLADDDDNARQAAAAAVVAGGKKGGGDDDDDKRWECCDLAMCTMSIPPICRCLDPVHRCSDACKECEQTKGLSYVCADIYRGDPGPRCHEHGNGRGVVYSGLADAGKAAAAAAAVMANDRKAGADDDDDEKRPWKCCNMPICTMSLPPICFCTDTVERCASTCEHCEQVEGGSGSGGPRYRCLDPHRGDPGPSCGGEEAGGDHGWARRLAARGHRF